MEKPVDQPFAGKRRIDQLDILDGRNQGLALGPGVVFLDRVRLNTFGRITDGTVIDVNEAANGHGGMQLLIYQYDVAGVSYECSQDVTHLRHRVDLHSCKLGIPTSVKYDPQNPGDSIVVSEDWIGLYQG